MALPILDADSQEWKYPADWNAEQRLQWEGLQGQKIAETRRRSEVESAAASDAESPQALIARAKIEADDAKRAREFAERVREGEAAWLAARSEHGAGVSRIDSDEGDVFVLRAQSDAETMATRLSANHLKSAATAAVIQAAGTSSPTTQQLMSAELKGTEDARGRYRDATLAKLLNPSRERALDILGRKPLIWDALFDARDAMITGVRVAEGKGSAP